MTPTWARGSDVDQPITILDAIVITLFAIGGICGGFVTIKVLMGYLKGMRP